MVCEEEILKERKRWIGKIRDVREERDEAIRERDKAIQERDKD